MDLARPLSSVVPGLPGRVLGVLGRATAPLTGRAIARAIDPPASQAGVAKVLDAYVREGVVLRSTAGSSAQFVLNRDHLAAPLVGSLAELRTTFLERVAAAVADLAPAPLSAYLYGSAARGDGTSASDIDLALVVADEAPSGDEWDAATAELRRRVHALTGNDVSLVEYRQEELFGERDHWLVATLRSEGIRLAGLTVDELERRWSLLDTVQRRIDTAAGLAAAGEHAAAAAEFAQAVDAARAAGDRYREATAMVGLADTWRAVGRWDFAAGVYGDAATAFGALGHLDKEGAVRLALSRALRAAGDDDRARDECASAVGLLRAAGDERGEANALLDYTALVVDDPDTASATAARARTLFERTGDRHGAGCATYWLGGAARLLGRPRESRDLFHDALRTFREVGDRVLEGEALLALATVADAPQESIELLTAAVGAFGAARDRVGEARAYSALGRTLTDAGRDEDALAAYRAAVAAFEAAGTEPPPHVSDRVRATRAGWGAAA